MASSSAAGAKPNFSSSLLKLKFMQKSKRSEPETDCKAEPIVDESKWTAALSSSKGCRVIMERDPAPGVQSGRMSFSKVHDIPDTAQDSTQATPQAAPTGKGLSGARPVKAERGGDKDEVVPLRPAKRPRS